MVTINHNRTGGSMKTVLFDLDGTLCDITHRMHFIENGNKDWDGFYKACPADVPKYPIIEINGMCHDAGHRIIISSGRSENVREETEAWLQRHDCFYHELLMRPDRCFAPDHALKKTWLEQGMLGDKADILFVIEDRDRMVKMWRSQGLTCLQVDQWVEEGEVSFPMKKIEQARLMEKFITETKQDQRFNEWSAKQC